MVKEAARTLCLLAISVFFACCSAALPRLQVSPNDLQVSPNGRFLVRADGTQIFLLADTAWSLARVSNADIRYYLADRASRKFNATMIQAKYRENILFNGHGAFLNNDTDTPNETFWQHIDFIVDEAARHGMYVGIAVMWAEDWKALVGTNTAKARRLGRWLGGRYRNRSNIYWIVSGEYDDVPGWSKRVYDAAAAGLEEGHLGKHLMTLHPVASSAVDFHSSPWLDFNMLQSSREGTLSAQPEVYEMIVADYNRIPIKPVFEGESGYEEGGFSACVPIFPEEIRRKAYWSVFAGGFGYTYGNTNISGMNVPPFHTDSCATQERRFWKDALSALGATQMRHLRTLVESRPILGRIPDQSVVTSVIRTDSSHVQATRAADGSYAWIYVPFGDSVTVNMTKISSGDVKAFWYNPRDGSHTAIGTYPNSGTMSFDAPGASTSGNDWVLILEGIGPSTSPRLP